ncbi:putative methyltransferase type 11 [Rosellinia necatrix]|uniref:Putative methyltransferase type 11 n=1 Tax=Rosellinia necatrix TaxID=77044 RepID=A0A1W2TWT8_ROSNE|nr:putative methyltransferase type 11 [Rosellinia necatrix]
MSATIHSEYAPRKRAMPAPRLWAPALSLPTSSMPDADRRPAGLDSVSGSKLSTATGKSMSAATEIVIDGATYNRSDSKKVDYVLVVDARNHAPLRKVFGSVWNECLFRNILPHMNHSLYTPLQWSPIACSIETKVEPSGHVEPLLQLGTWVASWHKRMHILRQYLFDTVDGLQKEKGEQPRAPTTTESGQQQYEGDQKRIPTSLVVKVINQEWRLYFATDSGDCINVYGPMNIGGTSDLMDAYVLLAVLEAIKDWVETTFREGVESWFMCESLE